MGGVIPWETSLRGRFAFRLAATSFLIPADWETNVRRVGPLVDEVELLFFDSLTPDSLPGADTIAGLARAARDTGVTYNLHLPSDISPAHQDPARRRIARNTLRYLMDLTATDLSPSAYTLHIPYDEPAHDAAAVRRWQGRVRAVMAALMTALPGGVHPSAVTVENLDYPAAWVWDATADSGATICMDLGHLMLGGEDVERVFGVYGDRVRLIHLHAVRDGRDHLPLTALSESRGRSVARILGSFNGTVSLEVFNSDDFWGSVPWLVDAVG